MDTHIETSAGTRLYGGGSNEILTLDLVMSVGNVTWQLWYVWHKDGYTVV